jgi:hypothetical protein
LHACSARWLHHARLISHCPSRTDLIFVPADVFPLRETRLHLFDPRWPMDEDDVAMIAVANNPDLHAAMTKTVSQRPRSSLQESCPIPKRFSSFPNTKTFARPECLASMR